MTFMPTARSMCAGLAVLLLATSPASAQKGDAKRGTKGALFFRVKGADTAAVASAEIVLPSVGVTVGTTARGEAFLTDVPNGTYIVQARAPGYRTEMLAVRVQGDTVGTTFTLGRLSAAELDTVHVDATRLGAMADFERRRTTLPYGRFLTKEQIAQLGRIDLASTLRDVQGVEVSQQGMGGPTVRARRAGTASACAGGMLIFVDGVLMTPGARTTARMLDQKSGWSDKFPNAPQQTTTVTIPTAPPAGSDSGGAKPRPQQTRRVLETNAGQANRMGMPPSGSVGGAPAFNLGSLPLALVAGIEVYTGASIPPQFLVPGAAECGVLAIWTTGG